MGSEPAQGPVEKLCRGLIDCASMRVMSLEDPTPARAGDLDLSDHTHAAHVIDLITIEDDRNRGCFTAMLCNSENRGCQPVCLHDPNPGTSASAMAQMLELVLPILVRTDGSILMARGRPGPLRPSDEDRAGHQRAIELCRAHNVRLLGFHIATPEGVRRLPDPVDASSRAEGMGGVPG